MDESPNTSTYVQMSMQELCSALNQEDAKEIKAILEVIITKLLPEVMSSHEKKNLTYIFLHQMALPVYYLNQSWNETYGEDTNRIVARAFTIFMCVIYEFKNKETKNKQQSKEEFLSSSTRIILDSLFESFLTHSYSFEGEGKESNEDAKKSSVMNTLSFQLSPYVKMLPRFDAIPVIISCMRQDDLRIVKMSIETLTLLCQWNRSFVKIITDFTFSSTVYTLLSRLQYNIFNNLSVNHFTRKLKTKTLLLQRLRNSASRDIEEDEEEKKRNVFQIDTTDEFLHSLLLSSTDSIQSLFLCSEENGQEEVLQSLLLLILYMEENHHTSTQPSSLLSELHALNCEDLLIQFLYYYIEHTNEKLIDLLLTVLLLLFQHFQEYQLFIDLSNTQKQALLKSLHLHCQSIYEKVLTLILMSILHTQDTQWFYQDDFTDSILQHYKTVSTTTQILINCTLRQFMLLEKIGSGLVNYSCYMEDICRIFELNLPWTKPYLAFILFTRLWKGFQPRVQYWSNEMNQKEGLLPFLHKELGNTAKVKNQIKLLYSKKEDGCLIDKAFDEYMKTIGFNIHSPLSFYPCLNLHGNQYLIMGNVQRAFLCKSFYFDLFTEENEDCLIKNCKIKSDSSDPTGMSIKLKNKGKIVPWDKGELKSRYFVVSQRYLYEYFDNKKNASVHKQIDLTNMNIDLCSIEDSLYIVLSYLKTPLLVFTPLTTFTTIDNYQIKNEHYPTQVYLWYYALKTITKLAFQPPTEEEDTFLPLQPNTVWRHDYSIQENQYIEKEFALKHFFGKNDTAEVIHHDLIQAVRLSDCIDPRVMNMLLSLLQEYDWTVMQYSENILHFIKNDSDESSRTILTNRGITYLTENRRKIIGIMTIQSYLECKQARLLLQLCKNHMNEILLLQKSIRAFMNRMDSKEEVMHCDKETTIEPCAGSIFSPRDYENDLVEERVYITQAMVNRCLEEDYGVPLTILHYMEKSKENEKRKSSKHSSIEEIATKIDRENIFAYYQCEGDNIFAIV